MPRRSSAASWWRRRSCASASHAEGSSRRGHPEPDQDGWEPSTTLSALFVAAACLCWGLDNNVTALIDGFTPAQSTAVKGLVAGAVNLKAAVFECERNPVGGVLPGFARIRAALDAAGRLAL